MRWGKSLEGRFYLKSNQKENKTYFLEESALPVKVLVSTSSELAEGRRGGPVASSL